MPQAYGASAQVLRHQRQTGQHAFVTPSAAARPAGDLPGSNRRSAQPYPVPGAGPSPAGLPSRTTGLGPVRRGAASATSARTCLALTAARHARARAAKQPGQKSRAPRPLPGLRRDPSIRACPCTSVTKRERRRSCIQVRLTLNAEYALVHWMLFWGGREPQIIYYVLLVIWPGRGCSRGSRCRAGDRLPGGRADRHRAGVGARMRHWAVAVASLVGPC